MAVGFKKLTMYFMTVTGRLCDSCTVPNTGEQASVPAKLGTPKAADATEDANG